MSILLMSLMLSQARVLPEVDRRALDLQARAEALQSSGNTRRTVARTQQRPPVARPASANTGLDLSAITTICRAAGNQSDPANFLSTLSRAYSLSPREATSLRTSCAAYLAGRADARTGYGAPAH